MASFECGEFEYEPESDDLCNVWVYASVYGNIDALGVCAQEALAFTEDTDTVFTVTWADTCSSLRLSEFGGGWIVIYAGGTEYGNTHNAADEAAQRVKASKQ